MQASRQRILVHLRRRPTAIPELARAVRLSPMTVRHHLARLQAEGLVEVAGEERRHAVGRPAFLYRLTEEAEELFPKRYDWLARLALDELVDLDPQDIAPLGGQERSDFLMQRLAQRAATPHRERLGRLQGQARTEAAAAILDDESGFVEPSSTTADSLLIVGARAACGRQRSPVRQRLEE